MLFGKPAPQASNDSEHFPAMIANASRDYIFLLYCCVSCFVCQTEYRKWIGSFLAQFSVDKLSERAPLLKKSINTVQSLDVAVGTSAVAVGNLGLAKVVFSLKILWDPGSVFIVFLLHPPKEQALRLLRLHLYTCGRPYLTGLWIYFTVTCKL